MTQKQIFEKIATEFQNGNEVEYLGVMIVSVDDGKMLLLSDADSGKLTDISTEIKDYKIVHKTYSPLFTVL